jgi:hypothetical protein
VGAPDAAGEVVEPSARPACRLFMMSSVIGSRYRAVLCFAPRAILEMEKRSWALTIPEMVS